MSRQIQVRQQHTNKSGFAINKYMIGSRYRWGRGGRESRRRCACAELQEQSCRSRARGPSSHRSKVLADREDNELSGALLSSLAWRKGLRAGQERQAKVNDSYIHWTGCVTTGEGGPLGNVNDLLSIIIIIIIMF